MLLNGGGWDLLFGKKICFFEKEFFATKFHIVN